MGDMDVYALDTKTKRFEAVFTSGEVSNQVELLSTRLNNIKDILKHNEEASILAPLYLMWQVHLWVA